MNASLSLRLVILFGLVLEGSIPTACGSDWPLVARDVQRSGATEVTLKPPFSRLWYRLFIDEGLMAGVQPVVAEGKLFVGTLRGTVYAIDAQTGVDVWKRRLPGAILHGCAVSEGQVFVPCADGRLYSFSSQNGDTLWHFATPYAIWNAPAVFQGVVYFGGRDGFAYALRAVNGELLWKHDLKAPVLASPALDPVRGRVFFAAENLRVYAFDLKTGNAIWQSEPLSGVTFRGYYPVVAPDGAVMVTTAPLHSQEEPQTIIEETVREIFGDYASWRHSEEENRRLREENFRLLEDPNTYRRQMARIREKLQARPEFQTFFLLDGETGTQRAIVPLVYAESMNGTGMPAVVAPDGRVIVKFQALLRSRYQHYSPFLNVGVLNTQTGDIEPLLDENRTYGWHDSLLLIHDEQCCLGVAGTTLINTHQDNVNALDLPTRRGYEQPFCWNVHEPQRGESLAIWLMHARKQSLPVGKEWLLRGTAVYGGGSAIDVAISIAEGAFYFLPTHELNSGCAIIAYGMDEKGMADQKQTVPKLEPNEQERQELLTGPFDWDMLQTPRIRSLAPEMAELAQEARQKARSQLSSLPSPDNPALEQIIWEVFTVGEHRSEKAAALEPALRGRLIQSVQELISSDWAPFLFPAGKHPVESYRFFADPIETLLILAQSYPYLNEATRQHVRTWFTRQRGSGGMLRDLWNQQSRVNGTAWRTHYRSNSLPRLVLDDRHLDVLSRLYPMWLWAHNTGDSSLESEVRERLPGIISGSPPPGDVDTGNAQLAGWIAAARWARHLGMKEAEIKAVKRAREALQERLRYEWEHPIDGVFAEAPNGRWVCARWRNLTPEVARWLAQHAQPIQMALIQRYVDYHRPTWWLAWNVELAWRNEAPFSLPSMSAEIFAAKALIERANPDDLVRWIDLPWCHADLFYIQKLIWTIEACFQPRWAPLHLGK